MKRFYPFLLALLAGFASCSNDEEYYPDLITEMAMAYGDAQGLLERFVTDSGKTYRVSNEIKGLEANETVRALIGYALYEDGDEIRVQVYTAQVVPVLPNVTGKTVPQHDPINVESVWLGGGFINMHLLPKSQGEKQGWAFLRDSTRTNSLGGRTHHLSLHHQQLDDPLSYSRHLYLSIDLDSVASELRPTDSITFVIQTFAGQKTWQFGNLLH